MRRNPCEAELRDGQVSEIRYAAKPSTRDLMVFMVFPEQRHAHVPVEQKPSCELGFDILDEM